MRGLIVWQLWWEDLLYGSYDERTYCALVMMRGPIVCQLWWEDLLCASYDERTSCALVMMRGPIVCQLWWEDLLYASYDERTYCALVMMRGPIVCQLWWEVLLYACYDERTYCALIMQNEETKINKDLGNWILYIYFYTITFLGWVCQEVIAAELTFRQLTCFCCKFCPRYRICFFVVFSSAILKSGSIQYWNALPNICLKWL